MASASEWECTSHNRICIQSGQILKVKLAIQKTTVPENARNENAGIPPRPGPLKIFEFIQTNFKKIHWEMKGTKTVIKL